MHVFLAADAAGDRCIRPDVLAERVQGLHVRVDVDAAVAEDRHQPPYVRLCCQRLNDLWCGMGHWLSSQVLIRGEDRGKACVVPLKVEPDSRSQPAQKLPPGVAQVQWQPHAAERCMWSKSISLATSRGHASYARRTSGAASSQTKRAQSSAVNIT